MSAARYTDAQRLFELRPDSLPPKWVFAMTPLDNGKCPTRKNWNKRPCDTTMADVREWVRAGGNVGLRTGEASGVLVLDVDSEDALQNLPYPLPKTVTVKTPNGWHFYFRHVPGMRNSVGKIAKGIDVRGDGGQVVLPGSVGATGDLYRWEVGPDE